MYCSRCGAALAGGAAFCGACGQPTGEAPPLATASPAISPPPAQIPPPQAAFAQPAPSAAVAPQTARAYAGFWLRFVAYIIDAAILNVVFGVILGIFMVPMGIASVGRDPEQIVAAMAPFLVLLFLISTAGQWIYFAWMESSTWQATLGKKALGLEVTDLWGRRIPFGRATARFFGKIISSFILLIGFIMAGFTEKKQALHDIIAGTLVLRKL